MANDILVETVMGCYLRARERNPARWSGNTCNWSPISAVTLNPERDVVVRDHLQAGNKPRLVV